MLGVGVIVGHSIIEGYELIYILNKIKINSPLKLIAPYLTPLTVMRAGQLRSHFLCALLGLTYVDNVLNPCLNVFLLGYFKVYKVTYANCPKQGL